MADNRSASPLLAAAKPWPPPVRTMSAHLLIFTWVNPSMRRQLLLNLSSPSLSWLFLVSSNYISLLYSRLSLCISG